MLDEAVLVDTDVLIEVMRGRPEAARWLRSLSHCVVRIPVFAYLEVLMGATP